MATLRVTSESPAAGREFFRSRGGFEAATDADLKELREPHGSVNAKDDDLDSNAPMSSQFAECVAGVYATCHAPVDELSDVHPPFADLGFVNPNVRHPQLGSQAALRHVRLLPQSAKHRRQVAVALGMLGLGHARQCAVNPACYPFANKVSSW